MNQLNLHFMSGLANPLVDCPQDRRFFAVSTPTFRISITRADGRTTERQAVGGTSIGHTQAAMEEAGIGGVVRVICTTPQGGQS